MRIRTSVRSGCVVLTLSGALDEEAAPAVRSALLTQLAARPWALIWDLGAVPHADPTGVMALTTWVHPAAGWQATRMVLCGVQPEVARAFQHLEIGQLGALPPRCETLDDAIEHASIGRPPRSDRYLLYGGAGCADDVGLALGQACERWGLADLSSQAASLAQMLVRWGRAGVSRRRGRLMQTVLAAFGQPAEGGAWLQVELHQDRVVPDRHPAAEPGTVGDPLLRLTPCRRPPGLCLEGEIDASNILDLAAALTIATTTLHVIHLDVARLESIDLAGVNLLARTARSLPPGGALVLHALSSHLRRVVRLAGWDQTPGLRLDGAA
ncbi:MAG TPA: STAS domain-containing protein [Actinomycetes bacterium]